MKWSSPRKKYGKTGQRTRSEISESSGGSEKKVETLWPSGTQIARSAGDWSPAKPNNGFLGIAHGGSEGMHPELTGNPDDCMRILGDLARFSVLS